MTASRQVRPLPRRSGSVPAAVRGGPAAARAVPAPSRAPSPPARHLRAVPDATAAQRRRLARVATVLLAVASCAGLLAIVSLHVLLAQGQVALDRLEAKATAEQARQEQLRLQVAELESPERIVKVARERLGMVVADHVRYLAPPSASPAG